MKYILCLLALGLFANSCNNTGTKKSTKTEIPKGIPINASGFARISSSINADIRIEVNPDSPYLCYLDCEKSIEPLIAFEILNDELQIGTLKEKDLSTTQPIHIQMRVKELKSLANNGNGSVDVEGNINAEKFDIQNSGNASIKLNSLKSTETSVVNTGSGHITLNGSTQNLISKITGSGNIYAYGLKSQKAASSVVGSGNMEISVSSELIANIVGAGNIFYKGSPEIKNTITGSGLLSAK